MYLLLDYPENEGSTVCTASYPRVLLFISIAVTTVLANSEGRGNLLTVFWQHQSSGGF
jgi:hypothetical protein